MEILPMRTEANTKGLKELISSLPSNLVMAEIGCYAGLSTKMFMESGKVKTLYAIDIWEDVLNLFKSKWKDHNFKDDYSDEDDRQWEHDLHHVMARSNDSD